MPALGRDTASTHSGQDSLKKLAAKLTGLGLQADLRTPDGELPYLDVRNPRAEILGERVYVLADEYWWAERLTGCDQVSLAASILAGVLHAPSTCTP